VGNPLEMGNLFGEFLQQIQEDGAMDRPRNPGPKNGETPRFSDEPLRVFLVFFFLKELSERYFCYISMLGFREYFYDQYGVKKPYLLGE